MPKHKRFFQEPTEAQIRRECSIRTINPNEPNLVEIILNLKEGEAIQLSRPMFPERINGKRIYDSREWMKHAPEVQPNYHQKIAHELKKRLRGKKPSIPLDYRRETFDRLTYPFWGGYSFHPFPPGINNDNRVRKVSLVECLEGSKICSYVYQSGLASSIEIGDYTSCADVGRVGAVVPIEVPSRTRKRGRYRLRLISVPVVKNDNKFAIGLNIGTEGHNCERKRWHFRYKTSSPETEQVFCAHERAAYRLFADHLWRINKTPTPTPYVMNPFIEPTGLLIKLYCRTLDSVLVSDQSLNNGDGGIRTTNKADEEIILWSGILRWKHDRTCYREKHGKKLKDEDWTLRYIDSKKS